ncbi:hypothetical protein [Treponema socranskii]|uniref:hypothetical protein n=1 Tax=Treponema socranskii TaxID=53419 RepID=UPI0028ECECFA|nr:hypothetical protein [Treponema socranskii]
MKKIKLLYILILVFSIFPAAAFQGGPLLYLHAGFGGALSLPSISDESLKQFNKDAVKMTGMTSGLLISGEVEGGYVFDSNRFFGLSKGHPFSALGVFAYIGMGQGNTSQKVSAVVSGKDFDTFMIVDFMPVIDFGLTARAYFFQNRLALGAAIGGRMIADMSPDYLVYSTDSGVIKTEVGQIIVSEDMMKKMNPFMFSIKSTIEYNISLIKTTDIVLGWYTRFNLYRPKYLTAPASLEKLAKDNGGDISQPFPDYWLNSLDFGVNLGFAFKL